MSTPHENIHQAAVRAKQREEHLAALDFAPRCDFHLTFHRQEVEATHAATCQNCGTRELRCTHCVVALTAAPCMIVSCSVCDAEGCFHSLYAFALITPAPPLGGAR